MTLMRPACLSWSHGAWPRSVTMPMSPCDGGLTSPAWSDYPPNGQYDPNIQLIQIEPFLARLN